MLNQVVLVGKIVEIKEIKGQDDEMLILAVNRSYKNEDGVYDIDLINCSLTQSLAKNTSAFYDKGDRVGIRGTVENNDGQLVIRAEKVTFIENGKKEGTDYDTTTSE